MKVLTKTSLVLATMLLISCGSTSVVSESSESADKNSEQKTQKALNVVDSVFNAYKENVNGKILKVVSSPKEIVLGKNFASPYKFSVTGADNSPVSNFELTVYYPSDKSNDEVEFTAAVITTDEKGIASFTPETPVKTYNSQIKVCPSGNFENKKISELAKTMTVTAPFKVSTNLKSAGGTLAIVDFTASGKPITGTFATSSALLKQLMISRFTRIGNAPSEVNTQVLNGDTGRIYSKAKAMLGGYSAFLIYGTVKHVEAPVVENGKTTVKLCAEIKNMNMKDGSVTYEVTKTVSATENNEWAALEKARAELTASISNSLIYGM